MRVAGQVARSALNDREAAALGLTVSAACLGGSLALKGCHRVCEQTVHSAQ